MEHNKFPIGRLIAQLYRRNTKNIASRLEHLGIGAGQYFYLAELYRGDGITQEELTEKVYVDKATTARAMKKLEAQGYIIRVKSKIDGRAYNIHLTEKAREVEKEFFDCLNSNEEIISNNISEEDLNNLRNIMQSMLEVGGVNGKSSRETK